MLKENKNIEWDYTDRVVRQLVDETKIDFKNSRVRLEAANYSFPFYSFGSRRAYPENLISEPTSSFGKYVISNYGLDEQEYKEVYSMYMGVIAGRLKDHDENVNHLHLHESFVYSSAEIEDNFLDKIVKQLLEETNIYTVPGNYEYEIEGLRATPPFLDFDEILWMDGGIDLDVLIDSDSNSANFIDFTSYCFDMYGLSEDESRYVWHEYRTALWSMDRSSLLGESKENLNSYIHKVVDRMVKDTTIKNTSTIKFSNPLQNQLLNVVLPFDIEDDVGKRRREISPHYIAHPTARLLAELKKHLILIYGMDKWEADQTRVLYLSKILEKINEYKSKRLNESEYHDYQDPLLSSKSHDLIKKVVDQLMYETQLIFSPQPPVQNTLEKNYRGGFVRAPYIHKGWWGDQYDHLVGMSEFMHGSPKLWDKIGKYIKETYGLTDREMEVASIQYNGRIRHKIKHTDPHNNSELTESVDLSYTDDKDFPFLNKLANHAMRETEISRNSVRFPFIDGYISNNNFHRYFDGTPYDQLPFEATIEADQYLKQFGLTENEKEIWWDIYVVKVRDAVDERDLKIIDNYGELNESIEDNILDRIAYSMYKESPPDKFPFDSQTISFTDHVKNVYGLSRRDATYVYEKFRYLKGWHLARNPRLPDPLNESKEESFIDKMVTHMVRETEIGKNAIMFPFNTGYASYNAYYLHYYGMVMEGLSFEIYASLDSYLNTFGLTKDEKEWVWESYIDKIEDIVTLKEEDELNGLNESIEPEDPNFGLVPIYEKIANSIVKESDIFVGREDGKLHIYSPAFRENIPLEMVLDQFTGKIKRVVPNAFVNHLKEIYNIKYPTFVHKVWELYRNKMIERMEVAQVKLASREKKQQQFFDHIINTLVDETEIQTMRDWNDDETYEDRVWVTPPFINHAHDLGVDPHREESVEWSEFSFFGYGYQRYMKEVYGLTDDELLKLWAPYYGGVKKRVEELIKMERKNIW